MCQELALVNYLVVIFLNTFKQLVVNTRPTRRCDRVARTEVPPVHVSRLSNTRERHEARQSLMQARVAIRGGDCPRGHLTCAQSTCSDAVYLSASPRDDSQEERPSDTGKHDLLDDS